MKDFGTRTIEFILKYIKKNGDVTESYEAEKLLEEFVEIQKHQPPMPQRLSQQEPVAPQSSAGSAPKKDGK